MFYRHLSSGWRHEILKHSRLTLCNALSSPLSSSMRGLTLGWHLPESKIPENQELNSDLGEFFPVRLLANRSMTMFEVNRYCVYRWIVSWTASISPMARSSAPNHSNLLILKKWKPAKPLPPKANPFPLPTRQNNFLPPIFGRVQNVMLIRLHWQTCRLFEQLTSSWIYLRRHGPRKFPVSEFDWNRLKIYPWRQGGGGKWLELLRRNLLEEIT